MKNRLKWVDGLCFLGETESGHALVMDGGLAYGGRNRGATPMELLLLGAAGCMSYDIVYGLKRAKQDLRDEWIEIEYEKADRPPKVYTAINFHIVLTGRSLDVATVEKTIKMAAETYCSASIMLGKTAKMNYTYELRELD